MDEVHHVAVHAARLAVVEHPVHALDHVPSLDLWTNPNPNEEHAQQQAPVEHRPDADLGPLLLHGVPQLVVRRLAVRLLVARLEVGDLAQETAKHG